MYSYAHSGIADRMVGITSNPGCELHIFILNQSVNSISDIGTNNHSTQVSRVKLLSYDC